MPGSVSFHATFLVALHSTGRAEEAIARLKKALQTSPNDRDILQALASFHEARGESVEAKTYADRLRKLTDQER